MFLLHACDATESSLCPSHRVSNSRISNKDVTGEEKQSKIKSFLLQKIVSLSLLGKFLYYLVHFHILILMDVFGPKISVL